MSVCRVGDPSVDSFGTWRRCPDLRLIKCPDIRGPNQ